MYLLDTNHCSRLLEGNHTLIRRLEKDNAYVATCAIVQGELYFMAQNSERKEENLRRVKAFLQDIDIYPIDKPVAEIYGQVKAVLFAYFGPKEKAKRRKVQINDLGFSDNDLWIAAIAKYHGLTVVSADSDFERMQEAVKLKVVNWLG